MLCFLNSFIWLAMARRRRKSSTSSTGSGDVSNIRTNLLVVPEHRERKPSKSENDFSFPTCFYRDQPPESWLSISLQCFFVIFCLIFSLYTWYWFDHFHHNLTHFYAKHVDDHHAQHLLAQRLMRNRSHNEAFEWYRRSADNGHPHSAYNLAAGHLSGYKTDVKPGNNIPKSNKKKIQ